MDVGIALLAYVVATIIVVGIILWLSSAMRVKPKVQSKMKKELFQSGDTIEAKPRKIYIDTYVFLAYFVLFDVSVFILATTFFVTGNDFIGALLYVSILVITLLVALKKKFSRDVIEPIRPERGEM